MRTIEDTRRIWDTLFHDHGTITDLRNAFKNEQGANFCDNGLRSICWKTFLLFEDLDRTQWRQKTLDSREAYTALREHYLKYIENSADLLSAADPLTDDEESPWQSLRRDEAMRAEIFQDVDRCLQERQFFREPVVKKKMLDVLFIYSKLNPDLGYRQGMHELLAPILWVVDQDAIEKTSSEAPSSATEDDDLMLLCLDAAYVEHDSFMLFCSVMQTARIYYEFDDQRSANGQMEVIPIVNRCQYVQDNLLALVDQELSEHLQAIEVLPQIFLTRWMRLLFGREFPFEDVLMIWDHLFADGLRADLIDYVCAAMLLRVHWQLLNADYSSALLLLLHYPSPEPHSPLTFVHDALYLEQSPTPRRGGFLISKYSGKPPETIKRPRRLGVRSSSAWKVPPRNDSRDVSDSGSSRMSARSSPNLETLLQDVSEGFQRRTESWGVAKAVRGAMSEAKRNMNLVHTENSFRIPTAGDKPSSVTSGDVASAQEPKSDFDARIERMEERNKGLAKTLSQALNDLRSQLASAKGLDIDTGNAMKKTLAIIQSVQGCLEDSSSPIGSSDRTPVTSDETPPDSLGQTNESKKDKGENPPKKVKPVTETPSMPNDRDSQRVGHSTPSHREAIFPIRNTRPTTRPSLAESEFSWMLEGSRPLAGFVSSSSETPEQTRTKSRQNSVFGGGGEESQRWQNAVNDELAMRSLRGSGNQE